MSKEQAKYCWAITMETVFSVGTASRLYNEKNWGSLSRRQSKMIEERWQLRASRGSRRQPATIWAWEQRNWGIRIIERDSVVLKVGLWSVDYMWAVPRYLERIIQWGCYSSFVKILCQETAVGNCNRLRTLVGVIVNCRVLRSAVTL
jgi:hypothetical protein